MTVEPTRTDLRPVVLAATADLACVLVFVAIGRRNHGEGVTLAGIAETAWPFLVGTAVGWLISRGWRRPAALRPTGLSVWLSTIAVGMALRAALGTGIAWSFVLVATVVTGLLLIGWRAALAAAHR